jgi:hypothetical protein
MPQSVSFPSRLRESGTAAGKECLPVGSCHVSRSFRGTTKVRKRLKGIILQAQNGFNNHLGKTLTMASASYWCDKRSRIQ